MASRFVSRRPVSERLVQAAMYLLSGTVVMVIVAPLLWMGMLSLRPPGEAFGLESWRMDFSAYTWLFSQTDFVRQYWNTTVVAVTAALLTVGLSLMAAYGLSRYRVPGGRAISLLFTFTRMFPTVLTAMTVFLIFTRIGVYDTLLGVILVHTVAALPISVLMVKNFVDEVPVTVDEAAMIDGASRLRIIWEMIIPLSRPGLVSTGAAVFLLSSHEFLMSLTFIATNSRKLLTVGLAEFVGQWWTNYIALAAAGVLVSLPLAVVFLLLQSYFVKGLTGGSSQ